MENQIVNKKPTEILKEVFESLLYVDSQQDQSLEDFVRGASIEFMTRLREAGILVPPIYQKALREEVESELHEMVQKKIYGFSSLQEFRGQHAGSRKAI